MRLSVLVLFLSPVSPIFAQSNPSIPFTAPPNSSPWSMQERDFSKLPPNFRFMPGLALSRPQSILALPQVPQPNPLVGMQLDPQIVVHPPQLRLGSLPPGTQVAQNLYPGLVFQPIDHQRCRPEVAQLSTVWPDLKVQRIPTEWLKVKIAPVDELTAHPSN